MAVVARRISNFVMNAFEAASRQLVETTLLKLRSDNADIAELTIW